MKTITCDGCGKTLPGPFTSTVLTISIIPLVQSYPASTEQRDIHHFCAMPCLQAWTTKHTSPAPETQKTPPTYLGTRNISDGMGVIAGPQSSQTKEFWKDRYGLAPNHDDLHAGELG